MLRDKSACKGSVLVETALIIPLLLTIAFSSFELSKFMNNSEILSLIGREGANKAFRDCAFLNAGQSECISNVLTDIEKIIPDNMKSSTDIIISIFTYNPSFNRIDTTIRKGVNGQNLTINGYSSKYPSSEWIDNFGSITDLSPVNDINPLIVVCETFYKQPKLQYDTLIFKGSTKQVYEATIY